MDNYEYGELLKKLKTKVDNISLIIKPDLLQKRVDREATAATAEILGYD